MATVNEKLLAMLKELMPQLEDLLASADLGTRMAVEGLRPSLERKIGEQLELPAAELDAALVVFIDFFARHRSDGAPPLIVRDCGAWFAADAYDADERDPDYPRRSWCGSAGWAFLVGDPVRAAGDGGGPDAER
jgi:hypothetical protein